MRYTFSSLNDRDLEDLARDLLSRELRVPFQSFKPGIDKGIDLRYSTTADNNKIIVQVKHYLKSGIKVLLRDLKKNEYPKIVSLAPARYILVTSVPLSPDDKKNLSETLAPFILSSQDIYGQEDLNRILVKYKEVEEAHFKLWLTSTPVLTRIIQNAIKGRSAFAREKIERKIPLFVANRTYQQAVHLLNKKNFLLITGAPGIGKTTLSDMLCYQLMAQNYELIYTPIVKEAEDAFLPGKKQVFYLDDFLGTITMDLYSSENKDAQLVDFIRRVQQDKTKRLILTCRTVIFNQAKESSERIEHANLQLSQHEVVLGDYSEYHKARILYNHIYLSSLSERYKAEFTRDQFYWKIIRHRNYNPRIIEYLTDPNMIDQDRHFQKSVLSFLDKPEKIWSKPFNKQLTWYARLLLRTLFSFNKSDLQPRHLKIAFEGSVKYEVSIHKYIQDPNIFNNAMKELEGAYIATVHHLEKYGPRSEMRILNPSLEDYLVYYYSSEGLDEYFDVLRNAIYTEQVRGRITTTKEEKRISLEGSHRTELWKFLTTNTGTYQSVRGNPRLQEMVLLTTLFSWDEISSYLLSFLTNFKERSCSWDDFDALIAIFKYIEEKGKSVQVVSLVDRFLFILANSIQSHWQIPSFKKLITKNSIFLERIKKIQTSDAIMYGSLQFLIDEAWKTNFDTYLQHKGDIDTITDEAVLKARVEDLIQEAKFINEEIGINISPIFESYFIDYKAQVNHNIKKRIKSKDKLKIIPDTTLDQPGEINRLFNSNEPDQIKAKRPF